MNGILIDKNDIDSYIVFPDGNIACVPTSSIGAFTIGDSVSLSNFNTLNIQDFHHSNNLGNDKLIDFF